MPLDLQAVVEPKVRRNAPPLKTPSEYPFPVFALCPPVYVDDAIENNPTMKEYPEPIDRDRFLAQWYNLWKVLNANSLCYLITPVRGLQDQTYVNCAAYLPHVKDKDTIVLSNFTGEGRAGEELVAGALFKDLGYTVKACPFKFEGEPELKYIRDNLYLGGWGLRTDLRAHYWLERQYACKIIPIEETDEVLYHLDCSAFVMSGKQVLLCTEIMDSKTVRAIEAVAEVIPVSQKEAHAGICNSLQVDDCIYNASPLQYMKRTDKNYAAEKRKNEHLEEICRRLGQELLFFDLSECEKSGAKLSCFAMHLNYVS